jgi:anti-sigma regulatory factor (Ser/Thr protein kinase)
VFGNPWVWLSFATLFTFQFVASLISYDSPSTGVRVRIGIMDGCSWIAVFAVTLALAWFFPLEDGRWKRSVPLLLACGTVLLYLRLAVLPLLGPTEPGPVALLDLFPTNLMAFMSEAGAGYAVFYHFRSRDSEEVANRLQAALARANLQLLETQIDPHFLFNTLNSVAALIQRDAEGAVELLRGLQRLVLRADAAAAQQTIAVAEEMELVRVYLAIEQRRLGSRLRVQWRVEPEAARAALPRLVLQTLAENAVRHGVAPLRRGGTVEIGARREGSRLHAWIEDDGAGLGAPRPGRGGIGMSNTAARLRHLYGADHAFHVRERPGGGVRAWIDIPFSPAGTGGAG